MATRMYINRAAYAPTPSFTPTVQGTWGADYTQTYNLAPVGHASLVASGFLTRSVSTNSSAATTVHALCYSPPISAAITFDSTTDLTVNHRAREASSYMNVFQQFYWGIVSNDGSILRALSNLEKGATEYSTSTSILSRQRVDADCGFTYTTEPGDRLFVEVGWDKDAAISGRVYHQYGYSTSSGDLLGDGDTSAQNPWCEWSNDFTFDAEGTTYGSTPSRLMMGLL